MELPAWLLFEVKEQGKECFPSSINDASSNLRLMQKLLILSKEESVLRILTSAVIVLKKTGGLLESIEISSTMIHDDLSGGIRFLPKMLLAAADLIDEAAKLIQLAGETARSNEKNWLTYEMQMARVNSEANYKKSRSRCDAVFPMDELVKGIKIKEVCLPKTKISCAVCNKSLDFEQANIFEEQKNSDITEGFRLIFLCEDCLKKKSNGGN